MCMWARLPRASTSRIADGLRSAFADHHVATRSYRKPQLYRYVLPSLPTSSSASAGRSIAGPVITARRQRPGGPTRLLRGTPKSNKAAGSSRYPGEGGDLAECHEESKLNGVPALGRLPQATATGTGSHQCRLLQQLASSPVLRSLPI